MSERHGRAVILTALADEYDAVRAELTDLRRHVHSSGTRYEIGRLTDSTPRWEVVLAEIGEGNQAAAILTGQSIDTFDPDLVLFVGIAGSLVDTVQLGDVVAATRVDAYHGGKQTATQFQARPVTWPASWRLNQAAREVRRERRWTARLGEPPPPLAEGLAARPPQVHLKPVLAGEVVVTSRESRLYRFLRKHYNDAVAVEMEEAGLAEAAHAAAFAAELLVTLDPMEPLSRTHRETKEPPRAEARPLSKEAQSTRPSWDPTTGICRGQGSPVLPREWQVSAPRDLATGRTVRPGQVVTLGLRNKFGEQDEMYFVSAAVFAPDGASTQTERILQGDEWANGNYPTDFAGAPPLYPSGSYTVLWEVAEGFLACDGFLVEDRTTFGAAVIQADPKLEEFESAWQNLRAVAQLGLRDPEAVRSDLILAMDQAITARRCSRETLAEMYGGYWGGDQILAAADQRVGASSREVDDLMGSWTLEGAACLPGYPGSGRAPYSDPPQLQSALQAFSKGTAMATRLVTGRNRQQVGPRGRLLGTSDVPDHA